ncbi:hypothetical protein [Prosthecochloris sp. SCSIO W1103]|uniref:hypothetical protein n=1 Tax=Prosthecochloris sp. SCSIO W1103 TaxID=2992244 RepID=UPI00223DAD55|nr:hypothetical protein [Prosthecochloris sp. SCSIO W1103]UZJ38293.1 hypothetical protein OO005_03590 [Prosthecochloris sp. SCSIO W1103]
MKKLVSLVFALAMMATFVTTSEASVKFSGDAMVRPRYESYEFKGDFNKQADDLYWLYRVRLHVAADLGEGYYAKAMLASESPGWFAAVGGKGSFPETLAEDFGISQFYFGRMMEHSHYTMGKMPLNSLNNPIFDLAVYPFQPLEIPYFLYNNDRVFALNYGTKVGPGELNATLCVLDNDMQEDDVFEDSYAIHLTYKTNIGDVTIDPQILAAITDSDLIGSHSMYNPVRIVSGVDHRGDYENITPWTFGTNVVIPAGDTKFTLSGFYTYVDEDDVNYDGYLFRVKAQHGPVTAWIDYNSTEDESYGRSDDYANMFVWAQYNYKVYESAMGSFTLSPTVRYLSSEFNNDSIEFNRLRTELWAQVKF